MLLFIYICIFCYVCDNKFVCNSNRIHYLKYRLFRFRKNVNNHHKTDCSNCFNRNGQKRFLFTKRRTPRMTDKIISQSRSSTAVSCQFQNPDTSPVPHGAVCWQLYYMKLDFVGISSEKHYAFFCKYFLIVKSLKQVSDICEQLL